MVQPCFRCLGAETHVCRDGVRLALVAGIQTMTLETDWQTPVSVWNSRQDSCSYVDVVLRDIGEISNSFQEFKICFARRTSNTAAHACAQQASSSVSRCSGDVLPNFIFEL